jgi:hypothetical protein
MSWMRPWVAVDNIKSRNITWHMSSSSFNDLKAVSIVCFRPIVLSSEH